MTPAYKQDILKNICYTELAYERINKKLQTSLVRADIEELIYALINETDEHFFEKKGKNFYITNLNRFIRMTINSYTFRIITVDRIHA